MDSTTSRSCRPRNSHRDFSLAPCQLSGPRRGTSSASFLPTAQALTQTKTSRAPPRFAAVTVDLRAVFLLAGRPPARASSPLPSFSLTPPRSLFQRVWSRMPHRPQGDPNGLAAQLRAWGAATGVTPQVRLFRLSPCNNPRSLRDLVAHHHPDQCVRGDILVVGIPTIGRPRHPHSGRALT